MFVCMHNKHFSNVVSKRTSPLRLTSIHCQNEPPSVKAGYGPVDHEVISIDNHLHQHTIIT